MLVIFLLVLMASAIPLVILYFIIKTAVKNAISEVMQEYKKTTYTTNKIEDTQRY